MRLHFFNSVVIANSKMDYYRTASRADNNIIISQNQWKYLWGLDMVSAYLYRTCVLCAFPLKSKKQDALINKVK